jgi:hypothetical protein
MNRKTAEPRLTVVEAVIVAGLLIGLVATGIAAVGFGLNGLFDSLRLP